jgi:hypothetical protein
MRELIPKGRSLAEPSSSKSWEETPLLARVNAKVGQREDQRGDDSMFFLVGHKRNPKVPGKEALDPRVNGSGRRLWLMLGVPLSRYLRAFSRVNAVDDVEFPRGSHLFVLGRDALRLLKLRGLVKDWKDWPWFSTKDNPQTGLTVTLLPHPSGKSLSYNDQSNKDRVRDLLREVVERAHGERRRLESIAANRPQGGGSGGLQEGPPSPPLLPAGHSRGPLDRPGEEVDSGLGRPGQGDEEQDQLDPAIESLLRRIA